MLKQALSRMASVFPASILAQGSAYQRQGHVLHLRLSDGLLKARVKGNSNHIYDIHIDLKAWPSSSARCSCQQQVNCKHAVACFYEMQARKDHPDKSPSSSHTEEPSYSAVDTLYNAEEIIWYSDAKKESKDFFSYQLGILIENKKVDVVPLILDLIQQIDISTLESLPDTQLIKLPFAKGKMLQIPIGRIKPLLRLLLQYNNQKNLMLPGVGLKMRRYQLMLVDEAEQAISSSSQRWQRTGTLQQQLRQLSLKSDLPHVDIPKTLQTSLRDYQHDGLNWLQGLRQSGFNGILADEMGLGKTIQTLAHLLYEKEAGRLRKASLIVAPTSLVWNWFDEAKRFAPELKVLIFHGTDRHQEVFDEFDLVISTYALVQRDKSRFIDYSFYYLILDEAQSIKNIRTKTRQIVQQLQGSHRLCLTGTPLENHLGELWSLFHFLMPGLLGDARLFRQFFRKPIEQQGLIERQALLNRRIGPFILRRSKKDVLQELPPKTETIHRLELEGAQRDLYEAIRMSMEKKVRAAIAKQGLNKSQIVFLDALLKLRQVCCDPRLLSLPEAKMASHESIKLKSLLTLLDTLVEEKRSVLVFSQFTSMLKLIEDELITRKYNYLKLTGQTQNRRAVVEDFQEGKAPICLISLKAGGLGLNLTRADTVIHYDPWWNPAVEQQATDRSHRLGQLNPVFVYKLITTGTVEEAILEMHTKKKQLLEGLLSVEHLGKLQLTEEDISQFFSPLS